jgi:hypothetical protein
MKPVVQKALEMETEVVIEEGLVYTGVHEFPSKFVVVARFPQARFRLADQPMGLRLALYASVPSFQGYGRFEFRGHRRSPRPTV